MQRRLLVTVLFGLFVTAVQAQVPVSDCPDNFEALTGRTEALACGCSADAVRRAETQQVKYPVLGMDIYPSNSPLCLSAVHAGVIDRAGGIITVVPETGRQSYAGVTRNGVASRNFRPHKASYRFSVAPVPQTVPAVAPAPAASPPAGVTASTVCPDNFDAAGREPLACVCTVEAVSRAEAQQFKYPIYGMDIYASNSPVCLAAVHAGVMARAGGPVTVIPEAGREAYPGVTRNGITSKNFRPHKASYRFAAPAQPVLIEGKPAQQPIAAALETRGEAQLYIQFRFNSAEIDDSATPTLMELRDALSASPALRLLLVGHTDGVGAPDYNRTLSLRRAQSVAAWLTQQGIPPTRLAADGKGKDQPIADNDTEEGRALNRRVQAARVP
jgi:outer membrane protein OmpA-like peptidoglycan-associated protein